MVPAGTADAQSVKVADTVGADSRGYHAGKRPNGRKRHLATETLGLLVMVTRHRRQRPKQWPRSWPSAVLPLWRTHRNGRTAVGPFRYIRRSFTLLMPANPAWTTLTRSSPRRLVRVGGLG